MRPSSFPPTRSACRARMPRRRRCGLPRRIGHGRSDARQRHPSQQQLSTADLNDRFGHHRLGHDDHNDRDRHDHGHDHGHGSVYDGDGNDHHQDRDDHHQDGDHSDRHAWQLGPPTGGGDPVKDVDCAAESAQRGSQQPGRQQQRAGDRRDHRSNAVVLQRGHRSAPGLSGEALHHQHGAAGVRSRCNLPD